MSTEVEAAATQPTPSPRVVYGERLQRTRGESERWVRWDRILSNLRLAAFLMVLACGWFAFGNHTIEGGWVVPPVLLFVALLIAHDRAIQSKKRALRRVEFYEAGVAGLEDRLMGLGSGGVGFDEAGSPFVSDRELW
ncbi:MAG: hypothetical protein GY944_13815, partial [bacterium]|nr:hypothetical protein [bacterium]